MAQARTEFAAALSQIASEKGVDTEVVLDAIRQAALAAYRKDLVVRNEPIPEDIEQYSSKVDPVTGEIIINSGDKNMTPPGFARIAAGIARQVIMQRLHEAEKGAIVSEYEGKIGSLISGSIQRQEGNLYFIDLGRAEGVMPPPEQVHSETYLSNQRMKFLIKAIRDEGRGLQVVVSRSDPGLVKELFALEVPEIQNGSVEIKIIAREAGSRTKIAVVSNQEGVDPVGSLVGQKGVRVQTVMAELGEEKIDIISYSEDPARFIASALSPAKDIRVELNEEEKIAKVKIPNDQLSLAIGKGGQNVRLAAKLTGYKIDIEGLGEPEEVPADTSEVKPEVKETENTSEVSKEKGTHEKEKQAGGGVVTQDAPTDDKQSLRDKSLKQDLPSETEGKQQAEKAIEEETKQAEENATTSKEKKEAQEAGKTLEKAVEAENPKEEKQKLEEVIGEVKAQEEDKSDEESK